MEQTEEWAVQRSRYMTQETLAPVCDEPIIGLPAAQTSRSARPAEDRQPAMSCTIPYGMADPDAPVSECVFRNQPGEKHQKADIRRP